MRKSELFAQILECVAFETEIAKEQILSKDKFQDVVDARYMLVHFCHKKRHVHHRHRPDDAVLPTRHREDGRRVR